MRYLVALFLLALLAPAWGQPATPAAMRAEIDALLREYDRLGSKPFTTKWPNGAPKEAYARDSDGTWSYTKFFQAGGFAVRYQKSVSKAVSYERFFANGKTQELLRKDERIIDYTSYWPNEQKKCKYQYNFQTKVADYEARDKAGKQLYPRP